MNRADNALFNIIIADLIEYLENNGAMKGRKSIQCSMMYKFEMFNLTFRRDALSCHVSPRHNENEEFSFYDPEYREKILAFMQESI